MAFKMAVTTPDGIDHPDAYWRPAEIRIDRPMRRVSARFRAWHNAAMAATGKAPLADAEVTLEVGEERFDAMLAEHLTEGGPNLMALVYREARAIKQEWDQSSSTFVSFFEKAKEV